MHMHHSYLSLVITFTATGLCWAFPQNRANGQEQPNLDEIIAGLARLERVFLASESFLIRYERTKAQDLLPSKMSGAGVLVKWKLARKADKWFSERRFTQPKKTKMLWIPAEPRITIAKESFNLQWDRGSGDAVVDELADWGNIYSDWIYTRNLSLDAPKYIAKSNGVSINALRADPTLTSEVALPFLPEFLQKNREHYRVVPTPEKVDGALCWVVEWPGMDRFWVDPQRGFAIPRRIYSWEPGKPPRRGIWNKDYREVKPGLWLPFTQIEDRYASVNYEKEQLWGKVTARMEYRVRSLEFDNVPNSLFDVKLPPGTRVIDRVRKFKYTTSGNGDADPFDAAIAAARLARRQRLLWYWAIGGVVFLGLLILVYRLWGRRKKATA
jgi:hypothetical protein